MRSEAVFKQQNPCTNHEIRAAFEHGVWPKAYDVIGQFDVISLCSVKTKWPTLNKLRGFWYVFTLLMLFS